MRHKTPYSFIDSKEGEEVRYCPKCEKVGTLVKLVERYDYPEGQELPYDHDNWLQCPNNGTHLIPIYESKTEGEYVPLVDIIENPFDSVSKFESVDKRKPPDRLKDYRDKEELDR